jgi:hypothetical protein
VADIDEKVMNYVEEALEKSPDADLDELMEGAKKVSPSVDKLTRRQFNARYPLQVKRRRAQAMEAPAGGKKKTKTKKKKVAAAGRRKKSEGAAPPAGAQKEAVREVFLQFAQELSGAQERKDLVKVLANVDRWVDKAVKVAQKG